MSDMRLLHGKFAIKALLNIGKEEVAGVGNERFRDVFLPT